MEEFVSWLKAHGAQVDTLAVVDGLKGGRGVIATRDLPAGDTVFVIPEKLMISEASVKLDDDLGPIFTRHLDLFTRDDPLLSTFLTYHIHLERDSFYFPYLSILPEPESIQNWTLDQLAALQHEELSRIAKKRNTEIELWYERITTRLFRMYPELLNGDNFPFKTFRFAWQTVQARTFGRRLPWTALVPLADMLNHANHATVYEYKDGQFQWHSSVMYEKGQQVFNSYGRRPNHQLLLDYGFALDNNPWDYMDVDLLLETFWSSLLSISERRNLLLKAHLTPSKTKFRLTLEYNVETMVPYCRCYFLKEYLDTIDILEPIKDVAVETQVWKALHDVFSALLQTDPTTLDTDEAMLKKEDLPDRLRTALTFRINRKRILSNAMDKAKSMIQSTQITAHV
ncbi:hypothetical protein THRCLA_21558 [Thraustotheca clavata]|uniref:SET domain-containing protein n=1 Tax=Thraustotheca clavata TaxID=74557 RepID=A0A1V9ZVA7_9STRA|nr:hypothetical protein THRCLA_21558 [Thraustotheca clavata]